MCGGNMQNLNLVVLLLAAAAVTAERRPIIGKIVGGDPTDVTQLPYQLSLESHQIIFWSHICGASIVSENAVVTAAHCVSGSKPAAVRFRSGTSTTGEGSIHNAKTITVHPQYKGMDYDVAVVIVEEFFSVSNTTKPITVASTEPQEGDIAVVSGWGVLNEGGLFPPKQLQSVKVPIVSRSTCVQQYGTDVTDRMICAGVPEGGKDSCQGDSGGPLVVNNTLAGIVSWGEGCARPGKSGVYSNVANLKSWIDQQIQEAKVQ